MYNNIVNLYNTLVYIYFNECFSIADKERKRNVKKHDLTKSFVYSLRWQIQQVVQKSRWSNRKYEEKSKSQPEEVIAD